jgi:hypothetical protein
MTTLRGRIRVLGTIGLSCCFLALAFLLFIVSTPSALAQQTLGGIRGTVTGPERRACAGHGRDRGRRRNPTDALQ